MDDVKTKFLEGCIAGFNDATKEDESWVDLTKAEKKKIAEKALADFDKIFFAFECVVNAGIDSNLN